MKTILDNCKTIFLDKLVYINTLQIIVSEAFMSNETQSIQFGKNKIEDLRPIERNSSSRQFKIEFNLDNLINFQLIDESFTAIDENEIRDTKGFLQVIQNSKYLDYVEKSHVWFKDVVNGEAKHFRIWTEDDVIDVISLDEPLINEIKTG